MMHRCGHSEPYDAFGHVRLAALFVLTIALCPAQGQTPGEHQEHHPQTPATSPPAPGDKAASPIAPNQATDEMSGMMRLPPLPPHALYPSLMALPDLTPEARAELERLADERMKAGTATMLAAVERLATAASSADYTAMQDASSDIREGLAQFESGAGTRRALVGRRAPRDIALDWFRREMHLLPPDITPAPRGPFSLTWFHTISMLILVGFALTMAALYFHKMRRAEALLAALAKGEGTTGHGSPPVRVGEGVSTATIMPGPPASHQAPGARESSAACDPRSRGDADGGRRGEA